MKLESIVMGAAAAALAVSMAACSHDPAQAAQALLKEGRGYIAQGKYPEAVIEIRRALQLEPHSAAAYQELAQVEMVQHKWPAAYAALQQVLDFDPGNTEAQLDVARLQLASRSYSAASAAAAKVLKNDPNNAAAWQVQAAAAAASGDAQTAERDFARITQITPGDASAWINLALAETSLRHPDAAESDLRRAAATPPHPALAFVDLAHLETLRKRNAAARAALQQGLQAHPDSVQIWMAQVAMDAMGGLDDDPAHPGAARSDLDTMLTRTHNSTEAALAAAAFYFGHGDAVAGVQVEQAALAAHPHTMSLQTSLLRAYLAAGDFGPAQQLDAAMLKQDPSNEAALLAHARLLLHQGQAANALTILQQLASRDSGNYDVRYGLGLAEWKTGRILPAIHDEELALAVRPNSAECLHALAELELAHGDEAAAAPYARRYLQAASGDRAEACRTLAQVDLAADRGAAALAALRTGHLDQSPAVDDEMLVAQAAEAAGQPELARSELEKAARQQPDSAAIVGRIVHLDAAQKRWSDAAHAVAAFAAARPHDPNGGWLQATLEMAQGQYAAARADLNRALALRPDFLEAKLELGRAWQLSGADPQALAWYQKALAQQPNFPPLLTLVGNLFLQNRRWEQAAAYYRRALAAQPDFAVAQANLAWVEVEQNQNLNEALTLAQQADRALPDVVSVNDTLAWVYYKMGSYGAALPILRHCVGKAPQNAVYHFQLGMTLIAQGDKATGRDELRRALELKLPVQQARQAQTLLDGSAG